MRVLHGVDIEVAAGEAVCLIGANGMGKTTLMRCLAGLLRPYEGTVGFAGRNLTGLSAAARVREGVALVPEGRHVFKPMTVQENLEMGAYKRLWPRRDPKVAADLAHIYEIFPRLKERRTSLAGTLSGGEQQMLAIGRALMSRPRLLLLDEPSMGLAPRVVQEIFAVIRRISAEGLAILLTEQNARMAFRTVSRCYVLSEGQIISEGTSEKLAADPAVKAAYLGI
ncbi:ABC transporter ATP-binding protein [Acuticoccus mangrovi]|nr:ABC transporter ATP-binding protein [Acuticoccus mangrovi]